MNPNVCNSCGGDYEYRSGRWVCRACGSYKPQEISGEEVTLLYTAYQKLRLAEFDEAEQAFDDIVRKFPGNPEGYWGRLLSRYGIKYEEDYDGRRIPTCYATSIRSVIGDADYQKACACADAENRAYYEKQAEYVERVRREWIEKASKEKPYDIFICYKESDLANGVERTQDSVAAQEIYLHLLEQGYRVFFSRESLRDKAGEKYEPYIFGALSTARVMLVYGSSSAYINSTWLKNEWRRFIGRIAEGEKHPESLLVACDGFSPAELPTALASRQCLDAKRRTFFGDLDQCIARIMGEDPKAGRHRKSKSSRPVSDSGKEKTIISGPHEHSYRTRVVKPTCGEMGYTLHQCECGEEYKDSFHPALGHQFSKWTESRHAGCTSEGEERRVCSRCGATETKTVPPTGHRFGKRIKNPDGTDTSYCLNCGAAQTSSVWDKPAKAKKVKSPRDGKSLKNAVLTFLFFALFVGTVICDLHFQIGAFMIVPELLLSALALVCLSAGIFSARGGRRLWLFVVIMIVTVCDLALVLDNWNLVPDFQIETVISAAFALLIVASFAMLIKQTRGLKKAICIVLCVLNLLAPFSQPYYELPLKLTKTSDGTYSASVSLIGSIVIEFGNKELEIPSSYFGKPVTAIGKGFSFTNQLNKVTIPETVVIIHEKAFYHGNWNFLREIEVSSENPNYSSVDGVLYNKDQTVLIKYPEGKDGSSFAIPEGVTRIEDYAFHRAQDLTVVEIPSGVTVIGEGAFKKCKDLKKIVIPNGVTEIGKEAFRACTDLSSVSIPLSVTSLGTHAFRDCLGLTIYYEGSESEWKTLSDGVFIPFSAKVIYNEK